MKGRDREREREGGSATQAPLRVWDEYERGQRGCRLERVKEEGVIGMEGVVPEGEGEREEEKEKEKPREGARESWRPWV